MTPRSATPRDRIFIACAGLVALAVGLAALSPAPVGVFWDDGVYVITAKALATGHGYRYINLPGAPAATHFPPLWPALLSLVWRVAPSFPENVRLMKLLNPVLLGVAAAGVAVLAVRVARIPVWLAALMSAVTIVVAPMLLLSAVLMSEPLCLALTAPALVGATLVVMRGRPKDALAAGILVGLAILARSTAIVMLPSLMVGLAWRRSRRASALAVGMAVLVAGPWFVWSGAHAHELAPSLMASYGPYAGWALDGYRADPGLLAAVIAHNADTMFHEVGVVVFGLLPRATRSPLLILLLLSTLAGLLTTRRRVLPLVVALAGYFALVVVWPYAPGRFVWAYFSLYAVLAAAAAAALARRARRMRALRVPAAVAVGAAALALAGVARYDVVGLRLGWHRTAIEANAGHLAESVGAVARLTAPADTIATDVNLTTYLYANRIALPITMLTVAAYLHPKSPPEIRAEFEAINAAFHPAWWIASGMVPERFDLAAWARDSASGLRPVASLPNDGLAARAVRR